MLEVDVLCSKPSGNWSGDSLLFLHSEFLHQGTSMIGVIWLTCLRSCACHGPVYFSKVVALPWSEIRLLIITIEST